MKALKSIFITLFLITETILAVTALARMFESGLSLGWLGVTMVSLPFVLFLGVLMVTHRVARTSPNLPLLLIIGVIGLSLAVVEALRAGAVTAEVLAASAGFLLFLIYDIWYSRLDGRGSKILTAGRRLPDFTVQTPDGQTVTADRFRERPSILLFYRGNWCPLCMAQVREIADQYREIQDRGARVALISPQPAAKSEALAKRFDVPMEFYVDPGAKAAHALGIGHAFGLPFGLQLFGYSSETVLPTVVITDDDGTIAYIDETDNYRVRPEPGTFIAVLDGGDRSPGHGAA